VSVLCDDFGTFGSASTRHRLFSVASASLTVLTRVGSALARIQNLVPVS